MNEIILIGGGGHCKSVIDVIEQEQKYRIVGIVDQPSLLGTKVLGYSVIGTDADLPKLAASYKFSLITIGQIQSPEARKNLFDLALKAGFTIPIIISPSSYVSRHAKIGRGTVIMHRSVVNASAVIGTNCIINTDVLIEHDSVIGDFCHVSTRAVVNGGVVLGTGSFVGSGAVIVNNIKIKKDSFIRAGCLFK